MGSKSFYAFTQSCVPPPGFPVHFPWVAAPGFDELAAFLPHCVHTHQLLLDAANSYHLNSILIR
jgi:hypothetical protein